MEDSMKHSGMDGLIKEEPSGDYDDGMDDPHDAMGGVMNEPAMISAPAAHSSSKSSSAAKYKKAPDAPKRFKSAFIIFSAEKHKEIKEDLAKQGRSEKTTDIAKLVSEAWREMPPEEKEGWEKKAQKDKARYEVEKAMYKGPWKIPANKRTPKDPTAPKRPMSAFLAFSNKRRAGLKRQTPDATNADLSKMLSKSWKEASQELRQKYMDEEAELRAHYKIEMAKWRKKVAEEKKTERREREALAMQAAEARQNDVSAAAAAVAMAGGGGTGSRSGGDASGAGMGLQSQQGDMGAGNFYSNPYGGFGGSSMGAGGQFGDLSSFNLQGGSSSYPGSFMNNPFAGAGIFGSNTAAHQQLLSQLIGQQFLQGAQMGGPLGIYGSGQMQGQGVQGGGLGANGSSSVGYGYGMSDQALGQLSASGLGGNTVGGFGSQSMSNQQHGNLDDGGLLNAGGGLSLAALSAFGAATQDMNNHDHHDDKGDDPLTTSDV